MKIGEYVPLWISTENQHQKLHNYANNKPFLFTNKIKSHAKFNVLLIQNTNFESLSFDVKNFDFHLVTFDRKYVFATNDFNLLLKKENDLHVNLLTHLPYLVMENIFEESFLQKLINFYHNAKSKTLHQTSGKERLHCHPDKALEKEIDDALKTTLYRKIYEMFDVEVKYRELYKLCSYNAESNGRFHAHRDNVEPHLHRKFAISLALNDDYEGGELEFVEYQQKLKLKRNSAVVFPSSFLHQVHPTTKNNRMVMITFICKEVEGKTKNNPLYEMK